MHKYSSFTHPGRRLLRSPLDQEADSPQQEDTALARAPTSRALLQGEEDEFTFSSERDESDPSLYRTTAEGKHCLKCDHMRLLAIMAIC
jgi:hypothetical protein